MKKMLCAVLFSVLLAGSAVASQPPAAQGEFVPATPGTATEQLPAAPLLIAAYGFVWIAAMGYVWSIARRLNKVENELRALEQKATPTKR